MSDYTKHYIEEIQKTIQRGINYGHTTEEKKAILKKFEQVMQDCLKKHNMDKDYQFVLEFDMSTDDDDAEDLDHNIELV